MYHGWADQDVPPQASINFYNAVQPRSALDAVRLFMVPGMNHCPAERAQHLRRPDGARAVGRAPEATEPISRRTAPTKNRSLQAALRVSQTAHYQGSGDISDAENLYAEMKHVGAGSRLVQGSRSSFRTTRPPAKAWHALQARSIPRRSWRPAPHPARRPRWPRWECVQDLPAFCGWRRRSGVDDSDIKIEVWLPRRIGAGSIRRSATAWTGAIGYAAMADVTARYVTSSTDTGQWRQRGLRDGPSRKAIDFAYAPSTRWC
jgi:hypothetical protein